MKIALPFLALFLAALPASAQRLADSPARQPAPWTARADTAAPRDSVAGRWASPPPRVAARTLAGGAGMFIGFWAGAGTGVILSASSGDEYAAIGGLVLGALVGSVAGAGVGAAIPEFHGECKRSTRIGRGLLGALVGGAVSGYAASQIDAPVLVLVGPPLGAALASDC